MMRLVFDTNIIISGRLWSGSPRRALAFTDGGKAQLLISEAMIDELKDVISRPKFIPRLEVLGKTVEEVVNSHLIFTEVIEADPVPPTIVADPDDDLVLACALGGKADFIVSGDTHLLQLKIFRNIPILTVNEFLERYTERNES
jgi:putative PIN family toxin of toxin-antitoxin system